MSLSEKRIALHTDHKGNVVGVSIDPIQNSEAQRYELIVKTLKHGGLEEEILFFRRNEGLTQVHPDDLLDLRLMYKNGDFPQILEDELENQFVISKRVAKRQARKTSTSA